MCVYVVLSARGAARNSRGDGGGGAYCQAGGVEWGAVYQYVCHQFEHVTLLQVHRVEQINKYK